MSGINHISIFEDAPIETVYESTCTKRNPLLYNETLYQYISTLVRSHSGSNRIKHLHSWWSNMSHGDKLPKHTHTHSRPERTVSGVVYEQGDKLNLYLKKKKTFMEAVEARTSLENSFPARYVESTDIYVSVDGDTPIPLKGTKKSIISFFDSNSSEVKAFIKSNRLKVNDINSLIKIFEFAEKL